MLRASFRRHTLFVIALAASPAAAQQPTFDVQEIIGRPHLTATEDGAEGGARGYGIRFHRAGWAFAAAGGTRETAPSTLRYELEAIGRRTAGGTFEGAPVADAALAVDESTVRYARSGFVERYELRREGVEQSFVFDSLPEGDGDLVVRGRLQTELDASASGADVPELRFTRSDRAGISVGRVTGIEAHGGRVEGTMCYRDGRLDLVLPASFVRNAALPLVIDPLVGPVIRLPIAVARYGGADVAYDANSDLFLVAYDDSVFLEPIPRAVVAAQRIAPDGTLVGPRIPIDESLIPHSSSLAPRVVPAGNRPGFVVAYELVPDLSSRGPCYARYVDASTGGVSARTRLGSSLHDIGISASGDVALAVHGSSPLIATRLAIASSGTLTVTNTLSLAPTTGGAFGSVSISANAGLDDRYLVVWDERSGSEQNLFSAFLDSDLNLLDGGAIGLSSTNKSAPAVDGDGTKWCVAYHTVSSQPAIGCFGVFWDPNSNRAYVTRDVPVAASGIWPTVAWTGESYLVAYDAGATSVDPFTCQPCEGNLSLPVPSQRHAIASPKSSTSSPSDLAMIVSGQHATFFRVDDGLITDLGGGCARGGRAAATCARAGNANFTLRVRGALPFAPAALVLSAAPAGLSCGPCTLVPDPASGLAIGAGSTDRWGDAAVPVPLPQLSSLVGAAFLEQWLIVGGSSCLGSLDLSNALRVEIQ